MIYVDDNRKMIINHNLCQQTNPLLLQQLFPLDHLPTCRQRMSRNDNLRAHELLSLVFHLVVECHGYHLKILKDARFYVTIFFYLILGSIQLKNTIITTFEFKI